jgi:hypothetical protein
LKFTPKRKAKGIELDRTREQANEETTVTCVEIEFPNVEVSYHFLPLSFRPLSGDPRVHTVKLLNMSSLSARDIELPFRGSQVGQSLCWARLSVRGRQVNQLIRHDLWTAVLPKVHVQALARALQTGHWAAMRFGTGARRDLERQKPIWDIHPWLRYRWQPTARSSSA